MSVLLNPYTHFNRFLASRQPYSYPQPIKDEINLVAAQKVPVSYGSYKSRIQKYPGDIDLYEIVEGNSRNEVINSFEKKFKKIVQAIISRKMHYFSEVKAGVDDRYDIDIGEIKNGFYHPPRNLGEVIMGLYERKLLTKEESKIIMEIIIKHQKTGKLDADDYDVINYIIREHYILRWFVHDILKGKIVKNGRTITLKEALGHDSLLKLDELTFLLGNAVEVTNVYLLGYYPDPDSSELKFLNPLNHSVLGLQGEIEKLYYSNMFYNPFKMVKRIFSLLKYPEYFRNTFAEEIQRKLFSFISSNTSQLYQMKSELSTIELIVQKSKVIPYEAIQKQADIIIEKLATNIDLTDKQVLSMTENILNISSSKERDIILDNLEVILNQMKYLINYQTIYYLGKVGLNPPPQDLLLPPKAKYNRKIIRRPSDRVENPMKKYKDVSAGYENIVQIRRAV